VGVSGRYTIGVWIGRPDGTPNPGFFGANIAAPLLHQIAYSLPHSTAISQQRPNDVRTAQICWPLGTDAINTAPQHCHVKHSAWILRGTIPPTLPDRLRDRSLLETIWIDPQTQLRTTPACNPHAMEREVARWPALLEAWLPPQRKLELGLATWSPDCMDVHSVGNIKIMGLANGSRLRPAPGQSEVRLSLEAVGGNGLHYWLLDGVQVERANKTASTNKKQVFQLRAAGNHQITVVDGAGHSDSLSFTLN